MAASPEVMQANGAGPPPGAMAPPAAAPMLTPQRPEGELESAKADCHTAMELLGRALSKAPPGSDPYKAILKCLSHLGKVVGQEVDSIEQLDPAVAKHLISSLAGPGAPPKPPGAPPQAPGPPQPGAQ